MDNRPEKKNLTVLKPSRELSLAEALKDWHHILGRAPALVQGFQRSTFLVLDHKGKLSEPDGKDTDLSDFFEVRVFTETAELRWLRNPESPGGVGQAVFLTENEVSNPPSGWHIDDSASIKGCYFRDDQYLLWGSVTHCGEWSVLHDHRIGRLSVPYKPTATQTEDESVYVALCFREYLGADDDRYGNTTVLAERLTGFQTVVGDLGGKR